jgi:hypothetical protein
MKKKADRAPPEQLRRLVESMFSNMEYSVECCFCEKCDNVQDMTKKQYAQSLYERGWRYDSSEKPEGDGPVCPECCHAPDSEKGDVS